MKAEFKEAIKYPLERALIALETMLVSRDADPAFAPIFIIAPARSGSTLLYQAVARYYELCYFSNAMTRFPDSPVCIAYLLALVGGCDPPENFRSRRGHVEGGKGPSDGTKIWARWFRDDPQYIPNGVLTPRQHRELRTTVSRFQNAFGAPFISKTQRNCGRILALAEVFPEAVFIRLHRDPFEMIRSRWRIYKTRDDENRLWQSYRPSNAAEITAEDPIEHLCQQVVFTEVDIDRDRSVLGSHRFFDVDYAAFCKAPIETLEAFAQFYRATTGASLKTRHDIPRRFESKHPADLPPEETEAIRKALRAQRASAPAAKARQ